jgi:hypothetical protein
VSEGRELRDAGLDAELAGLGGALAFPTPSAEFAVRVTQRLGNADVAQPWWRGRTNVLGRPVRRAALIAVALLLVLAAVAGAVGLGLPGLRIVFGLPPVPSPSPSQATPAASASAAPGSALRLGRPVAIDSVDREAGFHVLRPADPSIGPPDAAYVDLARNNQVSLVWAVRPSLPATLEPSVGLLFSQFDGRLDTGFFSKAISGGTTVEPVRVNGREAYWVSGDAHFFFYTGRDGQFVEDDRRWVGDALLWSDGTYTYRLETSLGRDEAIRFAESMR